MESSNLIENIDFYYDNLGRMVLTREYLLKRGHCCESGCCHCPYGFAEKNKLIKNKEES